MENEIQEVTILKFRLNEEIMKAAKSMDGKSMAYRTGRMNGLCWALEMLEKEESSLRTTAKFAKKAKEGIEGEDESK